MLEQSEPAHDPKPAPVDEQQPSPAVDVAQLADRVYRLMLADLRLSLARGERLPRPGASHGRRP
jgi:hypothetical protein